MIVPAILTSDKEEFKRMLRACQGFTDYVQIDIMDGCFVPSKSIDAECVSQTKTKLKSEAHLMVKEPLKWLDAFKKFGSCRIIFHFEAIENFLEVIDRIKSYNFEAGLAINPKTKISEFEHLIDKIDIFLFMSVVPGFYGSEFIPSVLDKIKKFKKLYPKKIVGIDGGIKLQNIKEVKKSGVDYICIGSAILKSENPKKAYLEFKKCVE